MTAARSKISATRRRESGVRQFAQSGRDVRFLLLDEKGTVVDRCRVKDFAGDIQDTFAELVRIHGKTGLSYRTEAL